jgi:hypothetical protein
MPTLKLKNVNSLVCGQKKAVLCSVQRVPVKTLDIDCKEKIVGDLPTGNRSTVLCLYLGERHIPFLHASNDGTAKFIRMQGMIGQMFEIEVIAPDAVQEKIKEVLQ